MTQDIKCCPLCNSKGKIQSIINPFYVVIYDCGSSIQFPNKGYEAFYYQKIIKNCTKIKE